MSKRVEVREGDKFALWSGDLYHMSGGKLYCIASGGMMLDAPEFTGNHIAFQSSEASRISRRIARAVVEEAGGEWAEVAEEKAATTRTKTLHVYQYHNGKKIVMHTNRDDQRPGLYLGTTTITIAGVT